VTDGRPGPGLAQAAITRIAGSEPGSASGAGRGDRLRSALPYLAAAALVLVFYSPRLLEQSALWMGDSLHLYVPYRTFATECIRAGRLPQWADQLVGGFPLLSDPQSAAFYPLNLLLAALVRDVGSSSVMDPFHLGNVILLALGGVFLGRSFGLGRAGSLACAVVIAFNGFSVTHLGQLSILQSQAAGVWFLGCVARALRQDSVRWSVGAGLFLAATILAGHPQMAFFFCYAGLAGGLLLALPRGIRLRSWKPLARTAGIGTICLCVGLLGSMVQILPTKTYLANSSRHFGAMTPEIAMTCSLPPKQLPGLVMPGLYSPYPPLLGPDEQWKVAHEIGGETLYACGITAVCLAILALMFRRRSFVVMALFICTAMLLLATLGKYGPLYPLMYRYLPGFGNMRFPSRLFVLFFVALGLLAGRGLDCVTRSLADHSRAAAPYACMLVLNALLISMVFALGLTLMRCGDWAKTLELLFMRDCWYVRWETVANLPEHIVSAIEAQLGVGLAFATACIAWLAWVGSGKARPRLAGAACIALLFVELWGYGYGKNIRRGCDGYRDMQDPLFGALGDSVPGRVLVCDSPRPVPTNTALGTEVSYANGYQGILLNWVSPFLPRETLTGGRKGRDRLMDLFNVSTLMIPRRDCPAPQGGPDVPLPYAGWIELSAAEPDLRNCLAWDIGTSDSLERVYLVVAVVGATGLTTGTPVGTVTLETAAGDAVASSPVRLGLELSPARVPESSADALRDCGDRLFAERFCSIRVDAPVSATLERVRIACTAPANTALLVSHLVLQSSGSVCARVARECLGEQLHDSRSKEWRILTRLNSPGYGWVVPQAEAPSDYARNHASVRERLCASGFDPARTVLLDAADLLSPAGAIEGFSSNVEDIELKGGRFSARTRSNRPGWLVVSAVWYPGWSARVDQQPTPLVRANGFMRAIQIPAGDHSVTMEYETPGLRAGAWTALLTWLTCGLFLLCPGLRSSVRWPRMG
jgi:hypothetical protein